MKKIKASSIFLFAIILTITIPFSCKKDIRSAESVIDNNSPNKNSELIAALINGKSFSIVNSGRGISPVGGGYSVSLVDNMLKFNDSVGVLNFLNAVDSAIADWDTNLDPELYGLPSEKSLAGIATLNAFDSAMNFSSLRRYYEQTFYDNNNFKDTLKIRIEYPDFQTILNTNQEIQIGSKIYKYINPDVIAVIANNDYNLLHQMRANPNSIPSSPNLTLTMATTGEPLKTTQTTSPTGCSISLDYGVTYNVDNDYRRIKILIIPRANNGSGTVFCSYTYYVKWGDGFETSPLSLEPGPAHTYNVTLGPGQCQKFTLSMIVTSYTCANSACTNIISNASADVNICNSVDGCTQSSWNIESAPLNFSYANINYRIIGKVGVQQNTSIIPKRNMIWSTTFWQKQTNNYWYPTKNKKVWLYARVYNYIYRNKCTTPVMRDASYEHRNQVHATVNDRIGERVGWIPFLPNAVMSDHEVRIKQSDGSFYVQSIKGHYLHY